MPCPKCNKYGYKEVRYINGEYEDIHSVRCNCGKVKHKEKEMKENEIREAFDEVVFIPANAILSQYVKIVSLKDAVNVVDGLLQSSQQQIDKMKAENDELKHQLSNLKTSLDDLLDSQAKADNRSCEQ